MKSELVDTIGRVPTIIQKVESAFDFLQPLECAGEKILHYQPRPPVYAWSRKSRVADYLGLAFYHRYDTEALHEHDLEGVMIETDRNGECYNIACIFHLSIVFSTWRRWPCLLIDGGGHGIHAMYDELLSSPDCNLLVYNDVLTVPWQNILGTTIEKAAQLFGSTVKWPWEWTDVSLENYVKRKHPTILGVERKTTGGMFFEEPEALFELAEMTGHL
jgi:hypothetical protein